MNKTIPIFAIFAITALFLAGCAVNVDGTQGRNEITTSGEAEKSVAPEQAELYLGVRINDSSAQAAQDSNARITAAVIEALKRAGVASEDIETLNYNLYPEQIWTHEGYEMKGYVVTNTIKVTTKDFGKVGTLLSVAVDAGANEIQTVQFTLTKARENEVKKEVLKEATAAAKAKAEAMAEGLGAKLGLLKSVSESNVYFRPYLLESAPTAAQVKAGETVPISPKKADVTASVTVIYGIR